MTLTQKRSNIILYIKAQKCHEGNFLLYDELISVQ